VTRIRACHGCLSALAVGVALLCSTSAALGRPHKPTIVRREHIARAGVYDVRISIASASGHRDLVRLTIGKLARRATLGGGHRRASVHVRLAIRGGMLTIRATAKRGTPKLDVRLRLLRSLGSTKPSPPKAAPTTRATGPHTSPGRAGPPGSAASWHQVFADEFNSPTLDASKWSSGWQGGSTPVNSSELQCYDPAQIALTNGELDLNLIAKPETCGGQTRPYASAMINTEGKYNYTYGYLEARVWVSGTTAITDWPAVWTDGQSWPQDGELDIMEGLSGQACWHFHDPQGGPGGCSSATYTGGWHTYGADWEAGTVTYYYDGTPADTITTGITNSPMYIILNLAADTANSGPLQAPATMRVDYIHLWQH